MQTERWGEVDEEHIIYAYAIALGSKFIMETLAITIIPPAKGNASHHNYSSCYLHSNDATQTPCRLWRQRGQNPLTQCPPRCSLLSSSVCSSCALEGGAFSDPQLPQPASGHLFPQLGARTTCSFGCDYHFHHAASHHQRHSFYSGSCPPCWGGGGEETVHPRGCLYCSWSLICPHCDGISRWDECPSCEYSRGHRSPPRSTIGDSNS